MSIATEGGIKFQMDLSPGEPLPEATISELNAWRHILARLKLIGAYPDGVGYGNISRRLAPVDTSKEERQFVITGTGTGGLATLTGQHYTVVTACYPEQNLVVATGPISPSAETMTHDAVYALDSAINWVIHVHSAEIWKQRQVLKLPATRQEVPYGSVEMTQEVRRLFEETEAHQQGIFAMDGHEDGIVSFGQTADEAASIMISTLARALQPS
jgi:ribulose-5-phosphate 4-epimerase/fuculose-1-phosphate aldolase